MAMKVRRVVTGHNKEGRSIVKSDSEISAKPGRAGFERVDLWATLHLPARLSETEPSMEDIGTSISNGSVFRIARYEPGVAGRWHATETLDYGVVLSGEMWMQLDEGEVHLKAGDVVVQRGTIHNWVNHGAVPCIMIFILIATEGGEETGW